MRFFILLISFIYLIIFEGGPGGQDPSLPQILKVRLTLAQSLMGERERERGEEEEAKDLIYVERIELLG